MRRRIICLAAIFLMLLSTSENLVFAGENTKTEEKLYIVFAVDHSGSMNSLDQQDMIADTLKAFADIMQCENAEIGYVAYNDTIIVQYPMFSVLSQEHREELKEVIESAQNRGETDIGLGLTEAYNMLADCQGRKVIVLISDGETDLKNSNTGRTREDSDRDVQQVIQECREQEIQITTIALGKEYESNQDELLEISTQTGGRNYLFREPDGLFTSLCDLFFKTRDYSVYEAGSSIYDQGSQKISCENSGYTDDQTLLLLSDKEIRNISIMSDDGTENAKEVNPIETLEEGKYVLARIHDKKGNLSISFDTGQKQKIMVYIIGRRNVMPKVEWTEELCKNRPLNFRIVFADENGNSIADSIYGEAAAWHAVFENQQTGESVQAEITEDEKGLIGTVTFESSGDYVLHLSTKENSTGYYEIPGINILNALPGSLSSKEIALLTFSGQKIVSLDEYFSDSDGDALNFTLQEAPENLVKAELKDNTIILEPAGRGRGEIKLLISDGEGNLIGSIPVRIRSFWEAYWQAVLGLICIIAFCIFKLYQRNKKVMPAPIQLEEKNESSFTGKLNAYFTLLPGEMEDIPPLAFALHPIRDKKIVLKDMFADYPELIDLLTLDNIYLFPAESRKVILYHDSESTVMIGNSIVCRKMQYIVSYGNVIYITSKDGTCELEVHYISMI